MIDYTFFNHEDFIEDPSFRRWVYEPQSQEAIFWQQWILAHPHKEREVELARSILLSIRGDVPALSSGRVSTQVKAILGKLETRKQASVFRLNRLSWVAAAAAVVLVIGFTAYFYSGPTTPAITYTTLTKQKAHSLKEITNTSSAERQVELPDGSTVILLGKSKISFPAQFQKERREVYLSGEAFFEVAKDPARPFYVYANELVTKVLGTSFLIKAYDADPEVRMIVKTGKVSVFTRAAAENKQTTGYEQNNLVLTPDQQAVLLRDKIQLIKSAVAQSAQAIKPIVPQVFTFDRTPVADVFTALEKVYGIDILFDSESVKNCTLTAAFENEPLPEKLQMICTIIEADYEFVDQKVIIHSKGCE